MSKDKKEDKDMETPVVAQPRSFLKTLGLETREELSKQVKQREAEKQQLVDEVIEEMKRDVEMNDWTAIEGLLSNVSNELLKGFLPKVNKAEDFMINPILAAALDDIKKETDKAHANMTSQEIFQDLISPTTEDNDDE